MKRLNAQHNTKPRGKVTYLPSETNNVRAVAGNLAIQLFRTTPDITALETETPVQETARVLYDMELNVFPLLFASKEPCFKWSMLQNARLHRTHAKFGLHQVFSGRCNIAVVCGQTSGNLFVLDSETPEQHEANKRQLRARGIPIFETLTSRGGHLYLRCVDGELANIPAGSLPNMEVIGHNKYVVGWGVHPTGVIYQWGEREMIPQVHATDIDWLTDNDGAPVFLQLATHEKRPVKLSIISPYSRKTQEYVLRGHTIPEHQRNNSLFSAACDMKGNNTPEHEARAALTSPAVGSGLSEYETNHTINNAYSKHRTPARKQPIRAFHWQRAAAYADTHRWKGGTGTTDRAVFLALIERARIGSNDNSTFRASTRELADLARVNKNTVTASLERLKTSVPAPLVCYAGRDKTSGATLWRFSDYVLSEGRKALTNAPGLPGLFRASAIASDAGTSFLENGKIDTIGTLRSNQLGLSSSVPIVEKTDAAERGALGKTGILIYRVMATSSDALTVQEIADRAKVNPRQVYHALRKDGWLKKSGLVEKHGKRWIAHAATDQQLDDRIARGAGKIGVGKKRRENFAEERAINLGRSILVEAYNAKPNQLPLVQPCFG